MSRKHTKYINPSNPLISVIMPTMNRFEWLPIALQSLIDQTYSSWECIVVNDFGENAQHVIDRFHDPRIKYYENDKNVGLAQTRNNGIAKASGDWFITLDNDDGLFPEAMEYRLSLVKKSGMEVVYTRALKNIYEKRDNGYAMLGSTLYWDSRYDPDLILLQNSFPCNCGMFSTKAQEAAGYYDNTLSTGEDWNHNIGMSRKYDFFESKILDCWCSFRTDGTQMTGTRDFSRNTASIFKKWRHTARNMQWVKEGQNRMLVSMGIDPKEYGLE